MRFLELDLERADDLSSFRLRDVLSFCAPTEAITVVLDRPDGATPRLVRLEDRGTIALDGFLPRLLADTPDGEILAVGTAPDYNGVLFTPDGTILRRYRFGDGIADLGYDPDGNILILRPAPPLLLRFGPDGERVLDDPVVEDILEATQQQDGFMLLIQNDGAFWLNLAEKYDHEGKLVTRIDPAPLFGAGRVGADLIGWEAIVVLSARGEMTALYGAGVRRSVKLPDAAIRNVLGRPLSADLDLFVTKGEKLILLATDRSLLLRFRILSE